MQTIAHGIDIVLCSRIADIWQRHGEAFLERVYTPAERQYCTGCATPVDRLAGRWAAKEAVLKALGTGWRGGLEFTHIEILPDGQGRPHVTLHGKTRAYAESLGMRQVLVSISHGGEYAVATALGLG